MEAVVFSDLADLAFMNYIDSLEEGLGFQRPYIFHRMHNGNGTNADWLAGVLNEFEKLLAETAYMSELPDTSSCSECTMEDDEWAKEKERLNKTRMIEQEVAYLARQSLLN